MQQVIRRLFGIGALIAFGVMCLGAGYQAYLLEFRPVVAMKVPRDPPSKWICGRAVGKRHCVAISPRERRAWDNFLLLLPICVVLTGGGAILNLSKRVREPPNP